MHTKTEFSSVSNQTHYLINSAIRQIVHYTTKANETDVIASPNPLHLLHKKITKYYTTLLTSICCSLRSSNTTTTIKSHQKNLS